MLTWLYLIQPSEAIPANDRAKAVHGATIQVGIQALHLGFDLLPGAQSADAEAGAVARRQGSGSRTTSMGCVTKTLVPPASAPMARLVRTGSEPSAT